MHQYVQQSAGEHSEAAGPSRLAGILLETYGTETQASRSNLFQPSFLYSLLGGGPLPTQTWRADQTFAPTETGGVVGHSPVSGAQL